MVPQNKEPSERRGGLIEFAEKAPAKQAPER